MTEEPKKDRRAKGDGSLWWDEKRQRWFASRIVGYDDRGKKIVKTGTGTSKSAATERLKLRIREYEKGLAPGSDKFTVSDALRDWLLYGQGQVDDGTVKTREYNTAHIDDELGDVLLRKLTAKHVEQFLASLTATHSTRTIRDIKLALNNAVKRAMARELVDRNVVELVKAPRGTNGRKSKSLSTKQALDVLTMTKGHWMYPYIVASMLTGIRTEEIRALAWDRVDLESDPATVEVWRSVRSGGDTKTEKSRRTLAIPDLAAEALRRRRREQGTDRVKAGPAWQETGLVFTTKLGTGLDAANVRRGFRSALKLVPSVDPAAWTPRELRHSFVSLMSASGAAVEQISHLVGHSDTSTTELIYRFDLRPVLQAGATFMNGFASVESVGPEWHMEPLFRMPGEGTASSP